MSVSETNEELAQRIDIVETMIAEGKRHTERWGWLFVLWGIGQLGALARSRTVPESAEVAWQVSVVACALVTVGWVARMALQQRRGKATLVGRALGALWWATGVALALMLSEPKLAEAGGGSGHGIHLGTAFALLGAAHAISGVILQWKLQVAIGLTYWVAAVAAMLAPSNSIWLTGVTAVLGVAFGVYIMVVKERA